MHFSNCQIMSNSAANGGGLYARAGTLHYFSSQMMSNTVSGQGSDAFLTGNMLAIFSGMSLLQTGVSTSSEVRLVSVAETSSSTVDALTSLVANLTATVALLNETLTANVANVASSVADHSAMLSCDASGRRLADTLPDPSPSSPTPAPTAKDVMEEYLARYPEFAATLTDEQRAIIDQHGQDFGLPALATGE